MLVVSLATRALLLHSDPPPYQPFGSAWGDEGPWNWPAAHTASGAPWPAVANRFARAAPLYLAVQSLVFRVVGPGLVEARLLSVVAGCTSAVLIAWLAGRVLGWRWGLIAGVGYAVAPWALAFERLATPEALALTLAIGSLVAISGVGGRPRPLVAWALAIGATAAKLSAAFAPVFVALAWGWQVRAGERGSAGTVGDPGAELPRSARDRTDAPGARWGALALAVVLGAAVVLLAVGVLAVSGPGNPIRPGGPGPQVRRFLTHLVRIPFQGPFLLGAPVFTLGLAWLAVAAVPAGRSGPPASPRETRLLRLLGLWVVAWSLTTPWVDLKGSRLYFLLVPLVLAGVVGWARHQGTPGRPLPSVRGPARALAATVVVAWLSLSTGVVLSGRTGVRALIWGAAGTLLWLLVLTAGRRLPGGLGRWSVVGRVTGRRVSAALLVAVVAGALPAHLTWLGNRTTHTAAAVAAATSLPGDLVLCGAEAPTLLLGRPEALSWRHSEVPGCSRDGRLADLVVVAVRAECSPYEQAWIRERREVLLAMPPRLSVLLPLDPPGQSRHHCLYHVVPNPMAGGGGEAL